MIKFSGTYFKHVWYSDTFKFSYFLHELSKPNVTDSFLIALTGEQHLCLFSSVIGFTPFQISNEKVAFKSCDWLKAKRITREITKIKTTVYSLLFFYAVLFTFSLNESLQILLRNSVELSGSTRRLEMFWLWHFFAFQPFMRLSTFL